MKNKNKYRLGWLGVALTVLLFSGGAYADSTFAPVENDIVMQFLGQIFGSLGAFSGGGDVFSGIIGTFNSALLVIGGVIVTYTLLLGIIGTAHEGEVLGKKLHSAGTPIKTLMGTALILPVSGGYSLIQIFVSFMVVMGIGIADATWSTYAGNATDLESNLSINLRPTNGKAFGYEVFKKEVCLAINAQKYADKNALLKGVTADQKWETSVKTDGQNTVYQWGNNAGSGRMSNPTACGTMTLQTGDLKIAFPKSMGKFGNQVNINDSGIDFGSIALNGQKSAENLMSKMKPLAQRIVNGQDVKGEEIDAVIENYDKERQADAQKAMQSADFMKSVSKQASDGGFIGVATYYMTFMQINDVFNRVLNNVPTVDNTLWVSTKDGLDEQEALAYTRAGNSLRQTKLGGAGGFGFQASDAKDNEKAASNSKDFKDAYQYSGNDLGKALAMYVQNNLLWGVDTNTNALAMSKNMGNLIINFCGTLASGVGVLMAATGLLSGGAAGFLGVMLQTFLVIAVPIGFLLAFVVPMVPLFIGLGVIISYLVLVVEAIILAPIIAIAVLNPHGDEYLGAGKTGITLIFGLTLRPVLIVLGFVASSSLLVIISQFIGAIFAPIFMSLNYSSGWFIQFLSAVGAYGIFGGLVFALAKTLFGIMGTMPDAVLQFLNGGKDNAHTNASHQVSDTAAMAGNYTAGQAVGKAMAAGADVAGQGGAFANKQVMGAIDKYGQNRIDNKAENKKLDRDFDMMIKNEDDRDSSNDEFNGGGKNGGYDDYDQGLSNKFGDSNLGGEKTSYSAMKDKFGMSKPSEKNRWKESGIASPKMVQRAEMIAKEKGMVSSDGMFDKYETAKQFLNENADHISADGLSVNMIRDGITKEDLTRLNDPNLNNDG